VNLHLGSEHEEKLYVIMYLILCLKIKIKAPIKIVSWISDGLGQLFVSQVGSGQPSLVWVWKISPKNPKFFKKISSDRVKVGLAYYLLRVKSKRNWRLFVRPRKKITLFVLNFYST